MKRSQNCPDQAKTVPARFRTLRLAESALRAPRSFKHVSPAGAAVAVPLSDIEKKAFEVVGSNYSGAALAYVREAEEESAET